MMGSSGVSDSLASLTATQTRLLSEFQKLSSGKVINSAADNPAGLAQSASFDVQISAAAKAMEGIQNNMSLLDTAGGAIGQIGESLQQLSELAVQAGSGALNASDRRNIQSQIDQIGQSIEGVAGSAQFNGQKLLDGSFNQSVQSGVDAGDSQAVSIGNLSQAGLGIAGLDVTTPAGQAQALGALSNARDQVNAQQSNLGAVQSSLESGLASLGAAANNLAAANSWVGDTDYAKAASDLAKTGIQQQASVKALALYNSVQKNTLSLLP